MPITNRNGIKFLGDNSCDGKPAYEQAEAEELARYNTERTGWVHNAYPCSRCKGKYHFGHAFPRERVVRFQRSVR